MLHLGRVNRRSRAGDIYTTYVPCSVAVCGSVGISHAFISGQNSAAPAAKQGKNLCFRMGGQPGRDIQPGLENFLFRAVQTGEQLFFTAAVLSRGKVVHDLHDEKGGLVGVFQNSGSGFRLRVEIAVRE